MVGRMSCEETASKVSRFPRSGVFRLSRDGKYSSGRVFSFTGGRELEPIVGIRKSVGGRVFGFCDMVGSRF